MQLTMGKRELDFPGTYLDTLREATDLVGDEVALRARLEEDGYLLIRGLLNKDLVLDARRQIVESMAAHGMLDPNAPVMDAVKATEGGGGFFGGDNDLTRCP